MSRDPRPARSRPRARRIALLGALLVATCGALGRARAAGDELVLDAGAELLAYARASHLDAPRTLRLNGAPVRVLSGTTPDGIRALLDVFHARCRDASGGLDDTQHLLGTRRWPRIAERAIDPVLRSEDARAGYVACLDLGATPLRAHDVLVRVRRFLASRDLADVGDLRFAWAFREGAATSYVAVYTDGPLPLARMFPARGDAPGIDVPGLPRPEHARRILSAYQEDAAPMLASYLDAHPPEVALEGFRAQLAAAGLSPDARGGRDTPTPFLITRGERSALAFPARLRSGETLLTVVLLH